MEIPAVTSLIPMIQESTNRGESAFDIYKRLLRDRIVFVDTPIDDQVANLVIAQLLFLDGQDADRDIRLYVNSPGGVVYSGLAIYDAMQQCKAEIATFDMGTSAGMATLLLAAGAHGKRFALPNARISLNEVTGRLPIPVADVDLDDHDALEVAARVYELLAHHTGQPVERIATDARASLSLTPVDAVAYGVIDTVLDPSALSKLLAS